MSDLALPHPFRSLTAILLKSRTGLWGCLLSILILAFLSSCMGTRSPGSISEKSLGLAPSAGPNLGSQAERLTLPDPISKGKESATSQQLQATFAQLPLSFISNRGQVDERVKFYGRNGSASFFFARDEVVYSFVQREKEASLRKVSRSIPAEDAVQGRKEEGSLAGSGHAPIEDRGRGHVVRLHVGANPEPGIEGGEELMGKVNYFIGNDPAQWKKGLPIYRQILYRELWPGIDLIYRRQGGRLKYAFVVKPRADLSQIRLAYRGIEELSISDRGDLILKTASGELRDSRPVAYQEIEGRRVEAEAGFRIQGTGSVSTARRTSPHGSNEGSRRGLDLPSKGDTGGGPFFVHGFEVTGYDPAYPLILDPGLEYATFLGGTQWGRGLWNRPGRRGQRLRDGMDLLLRLSHHRRGLRYEFQ